MYREVSVKLVTKYKNMPNKFDVVVQLCEDTFINLPQNNSIVNSDYNYISKPKDDILNSMHSTVNNKKSLRANFDVYIQSLTSQALDSNFLEEIYRENGNSLIFFFCNIISIEIYINIVLFSDEFFLSNINTIESVTQTWIKAMDSAFLNNLKTDLSRIEDLHTILKRFPILDMHPIDEYSMNIILISCVVCGTSKQKFFEVCFSGTEYNSQTLKNIEVDKTFSKVY